MFKDPEMEQAHKKFLEDRNKMQWDPWWYWASLPKVSNSTSPLKAETSAPECISSSTNGASEEWDDNWTSYKFHPSGPTKTSKAKPRPHWRPTRPITSEIWSTWNPKEPTPSTCQTAAPPAGTQASETPASRTT